MGYVSRPPTSGFKRPSPPAGFTRPGLRPGAKQSNSVSSLRKVDGGAKDSSFEVLDFIQDTFDDNDSD